FAGQDLKQLNESQLAIFRRHHCGFVFQQIYLLETMTLLDNALAAGRLVQADRADVAARARDLLGRVGLNEAVQGKFPAQVSGGEAGRAGIVRALMNRPSVVFADEPTGNLDQSSGQAVLDLMSAANREGQTVLMVTHDLRSALRGNRILFLRDGSITGDLALPGYGADDTDAARLARENTLRSFLVEMGW
ncbi:MAG: ABC transporter ATP-binding protein, partial [Propionibacteriaceae bacterium]|nr:ABC transporter ATP-binding protein [Propionibacteriaceae bacterium]